METQTVTPNKKMNIGIVVMGVSGCGKSEVGQALANYYQCKFLDGDTFHTNENITKMKNGIPLTDSDRFGWLNILKLEIGKEFNHATATTTIVQNNNANENENENITVKIVGGCSALRKSYRDILKDQNFKLIFIFLDCSQQLLEKRMKERIGHFMKIDMLSSQLKTLERPGLNEKEIITIKLDKNEDMNVIVDIINSKIIEGHY